MRKKFKTAYRVIRIKYGSYEWNAKEFILDFVKDKSDVYIKALYSFLSFMPFNDFTNMASDKLNLSWSELREYGYLNKWIYNYETKSGHEEQLPYSSYGKRTKDFKLNLPEWF